MMLYDVIFKFLGEYSRWFVIDNNIFLYVYFNYIIKGF